MTVKKLSKKSPVEKKATKETEALVEKFIGGGGKTTEEARTNAEISEDDLIRFTLRMPKPLVRMIDGHRKTKVGNISRNTWVLEAIAKRLQQDG